MGMRRRLSVTADVARSVGLGAAFEQLSATGWDWAAKAWRRRAIHWQYRTNGAPIEVDILGSRMTLDPSQRGLDQDLLTHGIREPVATGHWMRVLRPDDIVLEAGANIGYYTLLSTRLCRRIYAVEPHPENFRRLVAHLDRNATPNVDVQQLAFGPTPGPVHMRCSPLSNHHSCMGAQAGDPGVIEVEGRTIDAFAAEREPPTVLRMDIEGYEVEALAGATEVLRGLRILYVEVHGPLLTANQVRRTLDMILDAGLRPSLVVRNDWPGLARILPAAQKVEEMRRGDRCTYEVFFVRD